MKQKQTSHKGSFQPNTGGKKQKESSHSGWFPLKRRRKETKGNLIQWNTSIQSQSADREHKSTTFAVKASRNKTRSRLRVVIRRHHLLSSPPARSVAMGGVYSDIPGHTFVSEFMSPTAACPLCVGFCLKTKTSVEFVVLDERLFSDPSQ